MKEKIKKIIFGYLPGFITGIIICGGISVIAATYFPSNDVTYDNKGSGLVSTDVQGAIDELYGVCTKEPTAGDTILDNTDIVTSGDGLYEDEYEDGRYFYKGANPNNYVTFNNEKAGWRIISIEPDGTIKIMRTEDINNGNGIAWDTSNNNNWARPSSLNTYLNGTYYNGLNVIAKSQIVSKDWGIGGVTVTDYNNNLATQINNENATKWNGKVALVTASEYIRSNSNKSSCGTISLNNDNRNSCRNTTWMYYSSNYWWLLLPYSGNSHYGFALTPDGIFTSYNANITDFVVRPTLYLSSEVKIVGGDGSKNSPFELA